MIEPESSTKHPVTCFFSVFSQIDLCKRVPLAGQKKDRWQRFWEVLGDAAGSSWVWLVLLIRYWLLVAALVAVGHPFEGRGQAAAPSLALLQVSDKMVHD